MADTFSAFFEWLGGVEWRGSGVNDTPTSAPRTARLCQSLKALGLDVTPRFYGSMGGADQYVLDVPFLDGGLFATTGNYIGGSKCAVVRGRKAVRLVSGELGLAPPAFVGRRQGLPERSPDDLGAELEAWRRLMPLVEKTRFEVRHPARGRLVLVPGEPSEALDRLLSEDAPWAVLAANEGLREALLRDGHTPIPAVARRRDWEAASLFVEGLSAESAVAYASQFGQQTVLVGQQGRDAHARWC